MPTSFLDADCASIGNGGSPRVILHLDMDAFFASIEQRDDPALRGRPVIVGGPVRRGVVSTCSYEARKLGVHSAMPMRRAMQLCPQGIVVPVRMLAYERVSRQIMGIIEGFSPLVEPLSLDEAFLDMTGCERLFGPPRAIARSLQARVVETTQLTCSIGIACNKFLAKLASDLNKPNGITWVPFGQEKAFIAPLPVKKLWGVGPAAAALLERLGLRTIGEVAAADPIELRRRLGELGAHIHALSNADDDRPVLPDCERKSVGAETTLIDDIRGRTAVEQVLREQCHRAARHLRDARLRARGVRVKVRYSQGFQLATRDGRMSTACDDSATLFSEAKKLLLRLDLEAPIRLVGVAAFDLLGAEGCAQLDLFQQRQIDKSSKLEHTLDLLRQRFGDRVRRGAPEERERVGFDDEGRRK